MEIESIEEPEEDAAFHASVKRSAVTHPDEKVSADTIECEACVPSDPSLLSLDLDLDLNLDIDLKTSSKTASKSITATTESDSLPMLPTPDPTPEPDRRSAEPDKQTADSASACLAVFSAHAGLIHGRDERDRLHRDQLPAPEKWKKKYKESERTPSEPCKLSY
jgi:hypothetical protein